MASTECRELLQHRSPQNNLGTVAT